MSLVIGPQVVDWVAKRTNEYGRFGSDTGIGWQRRGELVAGVVYAEWNGPNVVCHIASDGTKRWATRDYLFAIFDYPFRQLKVNRITVCVGEGNSASRRFVAHLGFIWEATFSKAHPTGDLLAYVMWKGDCKWINRDYSQRFAKAA